MWECRKCRMSWPVDAVEPAIDNDGVFFSCTVCGHRNALMNVGTDGDIILAQPQFDPPAPAETPQPTPKD
jgi:hypothetical protein